MQWKWKACYEIAQEDVSLHERRKMEDEQERRALTLQIPQAALHSSEVAET